MRGNDDLDRDLPLDLPVDAEAIWSPSLRARRSQIVRFATWARQNHSGPGDPMDYPALHAWSVADVPRFWTAVREWFEVTAEGDPVPVLTEAGPGPAAHWFPGLRLNYAERVLEQADRDPQAVAVHGLHESGPATDLTWAELRRQVGALATTLRERGVGPGDRVVGYLPNRPEAVVALLATASLGAIWSGVGQDYAAAAAIDRFAQLEPAALVTAEGYVYGGRVHDRRSSIAELRAGLPAVRTTIVVTGPDLDASPEPIALPDPIAGTLTWAEATAGETMSAPVRVAFDHPLWVLFSSGTTGLPKGIVHGHGGILLEQLKTAGLHLDLGPGQRFLWFTSPSWMMWNYLVSGLLVGASIVTYDGDPTAEGYDRLWALAERHRLDVLGVSPAFLQGSARAGREPGTEHDLSALRILGATGSVLAPSSYDWVREHVGAQVQLVSTTGGTDVATGFAGAAPTTPIRRGELAARQLGVALEAWDEDGKPLVGQVGELVITEPLPSMPVSFWNDPTGQRYRSAYYEMFPGTWRHGDWVTLSERGSIVVHGRSDSTLNRGGVRMGSADIYSVVERHPAVAEALVIGAEMPDGGYWMPLFLVLAEGHTLDEALVGELRDRIRAELSPRHVPDEVLQVPGIPHTRTGKKLEIPVKRLLQGRPLAQVANPDSVDDIELLRQFVNFSRDAPAAG